MFLPMSHIALTVATTTVPAWLARRAFAGLHEGQKVRDRLFMTCALLTTWGRNILPSLKSRPTIFMPSMSGPSITSSGLGSRRRASRCPLPRR